MVSWWWNFKEQALIQSRRDLLTTVWAFPAIWNMLGFAETENENLVREREKIDRSGGMLGSNAEFKTRSQSRWFAARFDRTWRSKTLPIERIEGFWFWFLEWKKRGERTLLRAEWVRGRVCLEIRLGDENALSLSLPMKGLTMIKGIVYTMWPRIPVVFRKGKLHAGWSRWLIQHELQYLFSIWFDFILFYFLAIEGWTNPSEPRRKSRKPPYSRNVVVQFRTHNLRMQTVVLN